MSFDNNIETELLSFEREKKKEGRDYFCSRSGSHLEVNYLKLGTFQEHYNIPLKNTTTILLLLGLLMVYINSPQVLNGPQRIGSEIYMYHILTKMIEK